MDVGPVLVFDIETIPDVEGIRKLYELPADLDRNEVAEFLFQKRRAATGGDFLPLHLQKIVVISCVLRDRDHFHVWSLSEPESSEREIIQRFYDGIDRFIPQIISWNGGGFDLPVLHYRGLIHGVIASRYWDLGEDDRDFKWNNYISRYHTRHLDMMDLMALYQPRCNAPLDELARLAGFPGKVGMDGSAVWQAYLDNKISAIRDYCETDVVNTYLIYLRFQRMRGQLSVDGYAAEIARVKGHLVSNPASHWQEFLSAWAAEE